MWVLKRKSGDQDGYDDFFKPKFPVAAPRPAPVSAPVTAPSSTAPPPTAPAQILQPRPINEPVHPPVARQPPSKSAIPLPRLPADVWDTPPYRQALQSLQVSNEVLNPFDAHPNMHAWMPEPELPPPSSRRGLFGFGSTRAKGKKPLRLRPSLSPTEPGVLGGMGSSGSGPHGHTHTQSITSIYLPVPGPSGSASSGSSSGSSSPVPPHGPPIKFDHTGEFGGFVNHSNHGVMYQNKMYPTALHLFEAMRFTHHPELQEQIRTCKEQIGPYLFSARFQGHARPDFGQVFLQTMEDVLYLKFKQHPDLRALLLRTGLVDIVYHDGNGDAYWGEGPTGEGANELGKALMRVRERLRREGER